MAGWLAGKLGDGELGDGGEGRVAYIWVTVAYIWVTSGLYLGDEWPTYG